MTIVAAGFDEGWMDKPSAARQPKSYAILRVKKLKTKGNLGAAIGHNYRERDTPNADLDRTVENSILKGAGTGQGVMDAWDARAPDNIRKNAVHALEYFVGGSPEKIHAMSRGDQDAYFRQALEWFEKRHGAENVLSAVVHRDETTPHMQVLVIPIDERGKLNARALVGGKENLRQMQTDFARDVGQPYGLERGKSRSGATHQQIKEYQARAATPPAADLQLPERRRGAVMGLGGESDREWQERASQAATERLAHVTVHLTETNGKLHRELGATEAVLGQTQAELARDRTIAEAASKLVMEALEVASLEESPEKQNLLRELTDLHNHHALHFSEMQANATRQALDHADVTIIELSDCSYALTKRDLGALDEERLTDTDRQGADAMLVALHQAERSRQHAAEVHQEFEARKAQERELGQDSSSGWG